MIFNPRKTALVAAITMALFLTAGCGSDNDDNGGATTFDKPTIYTGFPITLKGATHESNTSVAYTGQMARHVMREGVKSFMSSPNQPTGVAAAARLTQLIHNTDGVLDDEVIIAPTTKGVFIIKETINNEFGTGRKLIDKMASDKQLADPMAGTPAASAATLDIIMGVPGGKTAQETIDLWIANFGKSTQANLDNAAVNPRPYTDMTTGLDYRQLILKYKLTGLFFSQAVDKYLDEYITTAGIKDNVLPYNDKPGTWYSGKEHSWDEGFGYFGAAANYGTLSGDENRAVNQRRDAAAFANADWNNDGKVSLYTEYSSGPANFAALFSSEAAGDVASFGGAPYNYVDEIMDAWLGGRTLITNAVDSSGDARNLTDAERATLVAYAKTITLSWEKVNAEAAHRYAGLTHGQMTRILNGTGTNAQGGEGSGTAEEMLTATMQYYKFWGELKGFVLGMQHGGPAAKMDKAEFDALFALIGYGPVLEDGSRVDGVSGTTFTMSATDAAAFAAYIPNMKAVQARLHAFYTLNAQQHLIP